MTSHEDLGAARRIVSIGLLALLGLLGALLVGGSGLPGSAAAAECTTCEEEEPPIEEEVFETLTVKVEGPGSVSDGTEAICSNSGFSPQTCEVEYELGEEVTLSATPVAGFTFLGWEGSGCTGTGTCSVTMSGPKSLAARFADKTPPPSPTISSPSSEQVFEWASGTVEVNFHVFVGTEPVTYRCSLDVNSFASAIGCSSPWLIKDPSAGSHTVYIWARDTAGNISAPASRSFKVVIKATEGEEESGGGEEPKDEPAPGGPGGTPGTGSTGSTSTQGVTPAIDAKTVVKTRPLGKSTVFRKLALKGLPTGAKVGATCKGKGCPFKRKQVAVVNGVASLTALLAKRPLAAGTLIELKVSAPGMTGQTIDVKIRAGKAPKVTKS